MELLTRDFTYELPEARIALFPAAHRDESKLLLYQAGAISHHRFNEITNFIKPESLLVFNNSKVIPARVKFKNSTGATIEIFLLHPADKNISAHDLLLRPSPVEWVCTIGNRKKWKEGITLQQTHDGIKLNAQVIDPENNVVRFTFEGCNSWAEVINALGDTPLPPYIKRNSEPSDNERYQTVYSSIQGAVAAPTAGLHFTNEIINSLIDMGVHTEYLTLHVSAGTFMPLKSERATEHAMHEEAVYFTRKNIARLTELGSNIVAVGTTSCRSLESLYWFGVKIIEEGNNASFEIDQHFAYQKRSSLPPRVESLQKVAEFMLVNSLEELHGQTSIYIYPGYQFKMTDGLITNFHQPNSTLLLLIAAFVGSDWKKIYASALENGYRFLSYGDSSLLLPDLSKISNLNI